MAQGPAAAPDRERPQLNRGRWLHRNPAQPPRTATPLSHPGAGERPVLPCLGIPGADPEVGTLGLGCPSGQQNQQNSRWVLLGEYGGLNKPTYHTIKKQASPHRIFLDSSLHARQKGRRDLGLFNHRINHLIFLNSYPPIPMKETSLLLRSCTADPVTSHTLWSVSYDRSEWSLKPVC